MGYDYGTATTTTTDAGIIAGLFLGMFSILWICIFLAIVIVGLIGLWKVFEKAGEEGWKALIPFYNMYILYQITWGNGWMFLLLLIPFVNAVIAIITLYKLAECFGKGIGFFFGLWFLYPIFIMILGFGPDKYLGPEKKVNVTYNNNSSWNNVYSPNMNNGNSQGSFSPNQDNSGFGNNNNYNGYNNMNNSNTSQQNTSQMNTNPHPSYESTQQNTVVENNNVESPAGSVNADKTSSGNRDPHFGGWDE